MPGKLPTELSPQLLKETLIVRKKKKIKKEPGLHETVKKKVSFQYF